MSVHYNLVNGLDPNCSLSLLFCFFIFIHLCFSLSISLSFSLSLFVCLYRYMLALVPLQFIILSLSFTLQEGITFQKIYFLNSKGTKGKNRERNTRSLGRSVHLDLTLSFRAWIKSLFVSIGLSSHRSISFMQQSLPPIPHAFTKQTLPDLSCLVCLGYGINNDMVECVCVIFFVSMVHRIKMTIWKKGSSPVWHSFFFCPHTTKIFSVVLSSDIFLVPLVLPWSCCMAEEGKEVGPVSPIFLRSCITHTLSTQPAGMGRAAWKLIRRATWSFLHAQLIRQPWVSSRVTRLFFNPAGKMQ